MGNQTQLDRIARANAILGGSYERINNFHFPVFGSDLFRRDDDVQRSVGATIAHRFIGKYAKPDPALTKELTRLCNSEWVTFDESLGNWDFYKVEPRLRGLLYRVRVRLHDWFSTFSIPYDDAQFTPGESWDPNFGKTSVYQKLVKKSAWTVTYDAADDFIRLCYNVTSLKRCAKKFFAPLTAAESIKLLARVPEGTHAGFWCFKQRMYSDVLTLVQGSRSSTVDKSNTKRRFINVEPLGNVLLQRNVAIGVRDVLRCHGNDLEVGQLLHRDRISDPTVATIDFSNASDGVILAVCKLLFPSSVYRLLDRYRSPFVLVDGVYYKPNKLSSMGNGFTFEIMSALLLAIARELDDTATVYGDDVIVHNYVADQFVDLAQACGFKVNQQKSFIFSKFRESCGGFYCDGHGYVSCYDIKYITTMQELIVTTNKFYLMSEGLSDSSLKDEIVRVYEALLSTIPLCYKGPVLKGSTELDRWAFTLRVRKEHMRSADSVNLWKRFEPHAINVCNRLESKMSDWVLLKIPKFIPALASKTTPVVHDHGPRLAFYLYNNGRADDVIRHKGKWVDTLHFVEITTGVVVSVRTAANWLWEDGFVGPLWRPIPSFVGPLRPERSTLH